jgi:hypothetical protein
MTIESSRRAMSPAAYCNCPRCGLTIAARFSVQTVNHCPRCIARGRVLVEMVTSTLPPQPLYAGRAGADTAAAAGEPALRHPVARGSSEAPIDASS